MESVKRLIGKVLGVHFSAALVIFLMYSFIGNPDASIAMQAVIAVLSIGIYWLLIYSTMIYHGEKDINAKRFDVKNGFIAAALVSAVSLVVVLIYAIVPVNIVTTLLAMFWFSPYDGLTLLLTGVEEVSIVVCLASIVLFIGGVGVSYICGKRKWAKTDAIIQRAIDERGTVSKAAYVDPKRAEPKRKRRRLVE